MIYYDLETTGVNVMTARIIEIYAYNDLTKQELHLFLNPGISIPDEATAVHSYTNDFVKNKPSFKDKAEEIFNFFKGESISGYNNNNYDDIIMFIEFERAGYFFDFDKVISYDWFKIWQRMESRTLGGAYKRFCSKSSEDLHGAKEDVRVLREVKDEMIKMFFGDGSQMLSGSDEEKELCYGQLVRTPADDLIINFGNKYKGYTVEHISKADINYLNWIVNESNMSGLLKFMIYKELIKIKRR